MKEYSSLVSVNIKKLINRLPLHQYSEDHFKELLVLLRLDLKLKPSTLECKVKIFEYMAKELLDSKGSWITDPLKPALFEPIVLYLGAYYAVNMKMPVKGTVDQMKLPLGSVYFNCILLIL